MRKIDGVLMWLVSFIQRQLGATGAGAITGLFIVGMMAFILYIVIANFFPSAQTANTSIQSSTLTDTGTVTSKVFFAMGLWLIPVGIFVALFVLLINKVRGKG
jgi:hypothetical protein